MTFSKLTLRRLAVEAPENLVLCATRDLIDLCRSAGCDSAVTGASLAELTVRWLLGDSLERGEVRAEMTDIESLLRSVIPGATLPSVLLELHLDPSVTDTGLLEDRLWAVSDASQRDVERAVRRRLQRLYRQTDGFVPVYDTGDGRASFIPFRLADVQSADDAAAVDVSTGTGRPIAGWTEPAASVLRGSGKRMVVAYRQRGDSPALVGNSMMLPLKVALLQATGRLPRFAPWLMLFTGALDAAGGLIPVKAQEKCAGVAARFQKSVRLVAPSDLSYAEEAQDVEPLPMGLKGDGLVEALKALVEALPGVQMTWQYADARLPVLEEQMRHGTVDRWDRLIARVDAMLRVFGRHASPKLHLRLLMLKSAAFCHAGQTEKALALNREAHALALTSGLRYEALRLEIEELVEFQDTQRFADIVALEQSLASQLENEPNALSEAERGDLRMRFAGTMGQVLLERSLLDSDEGQANASLVRIEKALDFARKTNRPEEILQDLNYRHLWLAYWKPGTEEEKSALSEASSMCRSLATEEARDKNAAYQARQRAIACFMAWKRSGMVSGDWVCLRAPRVLKERWLAASFARMKGALAAAAGATDDAVRIFAEGESSFPVAEWWRLGGDELSPGGVFAQIRLALLVQACCSLAKTVPTESVRYGRLAAELVGRCPNVQNRRHVDRLLDFLKSPAASDPRALPVLYY